MKSILFVINTMGVGGAEKAILDLFEQIDLDKYEVSLFVLTGQGELIDRVPEKIKVLNKRYYPISVLDRAGKWRLFRTVFRSMLVRGTILKRTGYIVEILTDMVKKGAVQKDKICWKVLSDGVQRFEKQYDLAVAYLEGGSAYYVSSYVNAKKKAVFIHTNYELAGYSRKMDEDCYLNFAHIFTVSHNVMETFLRFYPECRERTEIFYNLLDRESVINKAKEAGGFRDDYRGFRILTVGRLMPQKAHDIEIETMKILKKTGKLFRWYVLGEGDMRKKIEEQIRMSGLQEDYILLGAVENPYPYYAQCDLYVHMAYLEGKSIAIEEAQVLGCAILVSNHEGVLEQVEDGVDAKICEFNPRRLAEEIIDFAAHPQKREAYGHAASKRKQADGQKEIEKLMNLL